MKQENYKAIAEIINQSNFLSKGSRETTTFKLADYFEKESECWQCGIRKRQHDVINENACNKFKSFFNHKQFLEWCGVK